MSVSAPTAAADHAASAAPRSAASRIQAKLSVGPSHDAYEQEADRVAEAVVARPAPPSGRAAAAAPGAQRRAVPTISRLRASVRCKLQRQEEEEPQAKLQRQEEEEPQAKLQRQEEEEPQAKLQRQEEEDQPQAKIQREVETPSPTSASGQIRSTVGLESTLRSTGTGGRALSSDVRSFMEPRIGADFSGVRIHTGARAAQMSRELNAQAFTYGRHIYFNEGKYDPGSSQGQKLLAHELTHTVQQGASVRTKPAVNAMGGRRIQRSFFSRLGRGISGAVSAVGHGLRAVGEGILSLGRAALDALLGRLADFARSFPGYPLLAVILGRDPITQEEVPRTATNLVRGLLSLVPGGDEKFRQLEESGALERAFNWISEQLVTLGLTWTAIRTAFTQVWESLSVTDVADPIGAFRRIMRIFTPIINSIRRFARAIMEKVLEFIFEGFLGPAATQVLNVLRRVRSTFLIIVRNPVGFIQNLINAVRRGIDSFVRNIRRHLVTGLISWLTGALASVPIQLPERWDLRGILYLILQILGLTWDRIRPRLVRRVGERVVQTAETAVEIVRRLITEGPMALWEMIRERAAEIKQQVMDGIRNWIITRLVVAGVTRLVSFLNPAGAVVQAILAIYNTIMFFVENWQRISQFVQTVFNSVGNIASGRLGPAAQAVESAMAQSLPIIFNFLARLLGLGNIGRAITNIIRRIRRPIDRIVDRVIDRVVRLVRRLASRVRAGARSGATRLADWWRARKSFRDRTGETHTLSFRGRGRSARLVVASEVTRLEDIIGRLPENERSRLQEKYDAVLRLSGNRGARPDIGREIDRHLTEIADGLRDLLGAGAPPPSNVTFTTGEGGKAVEVLGQPLTRNSGNTRGEPSTAARAGDEPPGWLFITGSVHPAFLRQKNEFERQVLQKKQNELTRTANSHSKTHLLSERLHGPAARWNLTPTPNRFNSPGGMLPMEDAVREYITDTTDARRSAPVLRFRARVEYHSSSALIDADWPDSKASNYPRSIRIRLEERRGTRYRSDAVQAPAANYRNYSVGPIPLPSGIRMGREDYWEVYQSGAEERKRANEYMLSRDFLASFQLRRSRRRTAFGVETVQIVDYLTSRLQEYHRANFTPLSRNEIQVIQLLANARSAVAESEIAAIHRGMHSLGLLRDKGLVERSSNSLTPRGRAAAARLSS